MVSYQDPLETKEKSEVIGKISASIWSKNIKSDAFTHT